MKKITAVWALLLSVAGMAQEYGSAATSDPVTRIPALVKPVMDVWMRDTWVTLGPDGYYYLTGTTAARDREFAGAPHCWDWNDGIRLWRSKDLKHWEEMGMVWSLDGDAAWQQEPRVYKEGEKYPGRSVNGDVLDNRFRAVWAPELHYIKSQKSWFLVACMNNTSQGGGSFVLRSTTGRPEGPYENIEGNSRAPLFPKIDGSLFEDTDGTVYFVGHNHFIARMKPDMSGLAEECRRLDECAYAPEPYIEGAFIFKHGGKYHLVQAIWAHRTPEGDSYVEIKGRTSKQTRYSYDCVVASSDHIYGPYGPRYCVVTGGGHNNIFCDKEGNFWATCFWNPRGNQAKEFEVTCRPGIVPLQYENDRFNPIQ